MYKNQDDCDRRLKKSRLSALQHKIRLSRADFAFYNFYNRILIGSVGCEAERERRGTK